MSRAVLMKSKGSFPAMALAKPVIPWSTAMVSSRFSLSCTFFWAFGSMFLILTSMDFILPSWVLIAFGQINTFFNRSSSWVFLTIGCYYSLNFIRLLRVLITPSVTEGVITTRSNRMKFRCYYSSITLKRLTPPTPKLHTIICTSFPTSNLGITWLTQRRNLTSLWRHIVEFSGRIQTSPKVDMKRKVLK